MPNITILNGDEIGKTYEWTAEQIRLGRHAANDFVVNNASVSGEHCLIERSEGGWRVKDLDSTNGTRVNDQKITIATIHRNDVITLGDISISIRGDDVPEADAGVTESIDSIPRTTIVMRPATATRTTEGFAKKSESKKMLNAIIVFAVIVILVLAGVLIANVL
ncbi:MAG: FHA domain-containing protein [Kiritimatiellia bacterium]